MSRSSSGTSSSESGSSSQSPAALKSMPGKCPVYASSSSSTHRDQSALTNFL
eukprot:CAMPEP_0206040666 /NCGR_PEP_ID=MMETSP1466-20131121/5511_1 /ASSEMBLY_ACC=CAM_ASM_001126 /TAXON_ID=44452 /ORGANISM="Pavlova gyrans, Strain CCMP608" /LENGTH=51 /DNA_ID=CAMNT_0053415347 /DNA_START=323 /DNA_END=478 /DNA_ORIENTATION=-